jgi:hypothetical protein
MKKTRIKITHQLDKTVHHFLVLDPNSLTKNEVKRICDKMNVTALFINGKYYGWL